jgi:outer membrane biosynthesis protein TonB
MLYAVTGAVLLAAAVGGYFALRKTPEAAPLTASGPARIEGLVGARVSGQLRAAGGAAPYRWTIAGLPEGLRISEVTGEIEGIPAKDGVFSAEATVTDGEGKSAAVRVEIALTRPAAVPVIETPPPVVTRQEPPPVNKPKEKPKEIAAVPVPKPPPPVVTEAPKVVPEKPAETPAAEAEVARRGTMFWNGSLANGAVVTIEGNAASSGSLRGLPVPARIPVRIAVQSPNGVTVARQPDGGSNSFQLRNESGDAVSRIQFVWTRR